jgi:integrase
MRSPDYVPQPTRHKATGQAVVRLNGRDIYLGRYGSPAAKAKYDRLITDWLDNGRQLPDAPRTVNEIILAYLEHAQTYYKPIRKRDGEPGRSGEIGCIRDALDIVAELYGRTPAIDFGPRCLKAVRAKMLEKGWSRRYANHQTNRVRRMFRWATEEELIDAHVSHALQAVRGLRKGQPGLRETKRVRPAPKAAIKAVLRHVPPMVKAMILFQYWTGCRPSEACRLKPRRINFAGDIWVYRPARHKTAHLGKRRRIFIGPRAQKVLKPWLEGVAPDEYVFSPKRSEEIRNRERRAARKTPLWPSHVDHQERKRKADPQRPKRSRYDVASYRRAIKRACKKAKVAPWAPNQLRHTAATRLRRKYGIEAARTVLGHSTAFTTEIYAERDINKARSIMETDG